MPLNILTLGDSITDGVGDTPYLAASGSNKPLRRGYRDWLQQSFVDTGFTDYNFIGGRDGSAPSDATLPDGVTLFDPHNWGRSGQTAAQIANTINTDFGSGSPDIGTDPFGSEGPADVILVHLGTNSITNSLSSVDQALDDLDELFGALQNEFESGSRISSDARIFVSQIIPKVSESTTGPASLDTVVNTASYNAAIESRIDELDPSFQALFAPTVDLFSIDATDSDLLNYLASNNNDLTVTEIAALINPDTDDDTIDWTLGLNESSGVETSLDSFTDVNTALIPGETTPDGEDSDRIHPTDLGYQIIAYQYYDALLNDSVFVVPEPASLILVLIGACLIGRPSKKIRRGVRA